MRISLSSVPLGLPLWASLYCFEPLLIQHTQRLCPALLCCASGRWCGTWNILLRVWSLRHLGCFRGPTLRLLCGEDHLARQEPAGMPGFLTIFKDCQSVVGSLTDETGGTGPVPTLPQQNPILPIHTLRPTHGGCQVMSVSRSNGSPMTKPSPNGSIPSAISS